jgi:hypothetical protein
MMLHPVQIHADTLDPTVPVLLANEYLAIAVGLIVLTRRLDIAKMLSDNKEYIQSLIYLLHFHPCCAPEQLASEMYQLSPGSRSKT